MPGFDCPVCGKEMASVTGGYRCPGCGTFLNNYEVEENGIV